MDKNFRALIISGHWRILALYGRGKGAKSSERAMSEAHRYLEEEEGQASDVRQVTRMAIEA